MEKGIKKQLNSFHNFIQLILGGNLLYLTLSTLLTDNSSKIDEIEYIVSCLRLVQTLQIFDIIFNLLKVTSGSILGSFAQYIGRIIVTWLILDSSIPFKTLATVLICWSLSDIIRYAFYISHNKLTGSLRYNLFTVLYPIGVLGELLSIEEKIKIHGSYLRGLQVSIVVAIIFLYQMMLNNRKRFYRKKHGVKHE